MKEEKDRSRQTAPSHRPTRGVSQQVTRPPSDGSQSAALGPVMLLQGAEHPRATPTRDRVPRAPAAGQRAHDGLTTHLPWELHQIAFLCSSNEEENASAGVNERMVFQRAKGSVTYFGNVLLHSSRLSSSGDGFQVFLGGPPICASLLCPLLLCPHLPRCKKSS